MNDSAPIFDHHVHIKTAAERPWGRATEVLLDGETFYCESLKVEFRGDSLNMVTITFPARVTMEETA